MNTDDFVSSINQWARSIPAGDRKVLALAGAPGSGKSTLAERLLHELGDIAALLPMDGFHYDDEVLVPRGWRDRKGAPHTFDVDGFAAILARLRDNEAEIAVPRFDRDLEISRGSARLVPRSVRLIVAEGNYLLLDEAPWSSLRPAFDRTAFLDVSLDELTRRLSERWQGYGLSGDDFVRKMEGNDLPNVRTVIERSAEPDFRIVP